VLSGGLDDGTDGLGIIKENGGIAIAQHPQDATFSSMPASAIQNVTVDHVVAAAQMAPILVRYATQELSKEESMPPNPEFKDVAALGDHGLRDRTINGNPSPLTCPECGGTLWETQRGHRLRYQWHVGHAYTGDTLVSERDRELEQALWSAVRTMEEAAALRRRMAGLAERAPWQPAAPPYARQAAEMERRAQVIRRVLEKRSAEAPKPGARAAKSRKKENRGSGNGSRKRRNMRAGNRTD